MPRQFLQVVSGGKNLPAGGDDDDAHVPVGCSLVETLAKRFENGDRKGVGRWIVERQPKNSVRLAGDDEAVVLMRFQGDDVCHVILQIRVRMSAPAAAPAGRLDGLRSIAFYAPGKRQAQ